MTGRIDLTKHEFTVTQNNRILGHFSNYEQALFTAGQRYTTKGGLAINGEKVKKAQLDEALENYGNPPLAVALDTIMTSEVLQ